jgi:hypothetical protein
VGRRLKLELVHSPGAGPAGSDLVSGEGESWRLPCMVPEPIGEESLVSQRLWLFLERPKPRTRAKDGSKRGLSTFRGRRLCFNKRADSRKVECTLLRTIENKQPTQEHGSSGQPRIRKPSRANAIRDPGASDPCKSETIRGNPCPISSSLTTQSTRLPGLRPRAAVVRARACLPKLR